MARTPEIRKLAMETSGLVHECAARMIEQIVEAIHDSHIRPLKQAVAAALHELNYHNPERAAEILRSAITDKRAA